MTNGKDARLAIADRIADELNADILFFSGEITPRSWLDLVNVCRPRKRRPNVFLILVTPGGDPDAAFKIGRLLQSKYAKISVFITGWCKSAGTLVTLAAQELFMSDYGELGPLDIALIDADAPKPGQPRKTVNAT